LYGSTYCHTAWAKIVLSKPATLDNWTEAGVEIYDHDDHLRVSMDCDKRFGGNGPVRKNQTSCYTGQYNDKDPYKAKGIAMINFHVIAETNKY
jgi:hypothetical protein